MRVLEVEIFGRGGLTHYVFNLSRHLARRGVEVTIATASDYELADRLRELPDNVRVARVVSRRAARLRGRLPYRVLRAIKGLEFFGDALGIRRLARETAPDIIHIHCTNAIVLWMMRLLRPLGVPLVYTAHDITPHEDHPAAHRMYRSIYRLSDHVIAHSERDRERLAEEFGVAGRSVSVLAHGDYRFFNGPSRAPTREASRAELGVAPDAEVVLFFGFIREYKGLDLLLDAWPDVAATHPGARLLIVGDPSRLGAERREDLRARALRLGAVVHFGYIPFEKVSSCFAAADLLVLPYRRISQSGVLMLAMSLGLPVVATAVGAFPEVIRDGENGVLVEPDSAPALAGGIHRLLADPDLRRRCVAAGHETVRRLGSWEDIAAGTHRLFESIRSARSSRADASASNRG